MNILDSRDLNARIEELAIDIADSHYNNPKNTDSALNVRDVMEHNATYLKNSTVDMEDEIEELFSIMQLEDDVGSSEWAFGLILIPTDYFTEYCKELVTDCYSLDVPSCVVIDWEETANNLSQDYSLVTFEGDDYYYQG